MTRSPNVPSLHLVVLLSLLPVILGSTLACSRPAEHDDHAAETGHADRTASGDGSATTARADASAHAPANAPDGEPGSGPATAVGLDLAGVRGVTFAPVGEPREEGAWLAAEAISDPGAESVLSAPVAGQVIAFHAVPGTRLATGAPVVELRSPELADLAARLLTARARRARAESELARERRLTTAAATSARELEAAEAEALVAAAEESGARLALAGRGVDPERPGTTFLVRAARGGTLFASRRRARRERRVGAAPRPAGGRRRRAGAGRDPAPRPAGVAPRCRDRGAARRRETLAGRG